ncbi:MAG: ThiF family adenylyltransferase [Spirochaetota bacterium]
MSFTERTRILLGDEGIEALAGASVAVYGLGGVGGAAAMDLVRAGVGRIVAVDFDLVQESNLNRLYFAYREDIGKSKAEVFATRARAINPDIVVEARRLFFSGADAAGIVADCDIHLDCVDALNPKISLLTALAALPKPFATSLGTAGRSDPTRLRLGSVWKSRGCPLGREVRNRIKRRGVTRDFPAVWSDEPPVAPRPRPPGPHEAQTAPGRIRNIQGSGPSVPQTAGHFLASWAIGELIRQVEGKESAWTQ